MSGGHYDYKYFQVNELADSIERDFVNEGRYKPEYDTASGDYLEGATDEQRATILAEVASLVADLNRCAKRARELEWFQSGDHGIGSYLRRLQEINEPK